jgi:hypothetical protein
MHFTNSSMRQVVCVNGSSFCFKMYKRNRNTNSLCTELPTVHTYLRTACRHILSTVHVTLQLLYASNGSSLTYSHRSVTVHKIIVVYDMKMIMQHTLRHLFLLDRYLNVNDKHTEQGSKRNIHLTKTKNSYISSESKLCGVSVALHILSVCNIRQNPSFSSASNYVRKYAGECNEKGYMLLHPFSLTCEQLHYIDVCKFKSDTNSAQEPSN